MQDQMLPADYSLSVQHMFVGFFADCIISLENLHILFRAAGLDPPASSLSWVPNWAGDWSHIFTAPDVDLYQVECIKQYLGHNDVRWIVNDAKYSDLQSNMTPRLCHSRDWVRFLFHRRSCHQDIAIESDAGVLSIYLTYLCIIRSPADGHQRPWILLDSRDTRGIGHGPSGGSVRRTKCFFPGAEKVKDTLPAYRHIYNQEDCSLSTFEEWRLSKLDLHYHPRIIDGFLGLSIPFFSGHWEGINSFGNRLEVVTLRLCDLTMPITNFWERRNWGKWEKPRNRPQPPKANARIPLEVRQTVQARAPMWELNFLHFWCIHVSRVHRSLGCAIDDLEALLLGQNPLSEQHHLTACLRIN
ncbi:hypothetical protein BBP40_003448 [Aspergillus hancockii]|nr:hypothetical protein BBP40_003448 [Aspergillus hancockii]